MMIFFFSRDRNHVMQLMKRFPGIEEETLRKSFPNVNIDHVRHNKKTLGHHDKNEA